MKSHFHATAAGYLVLALAGRVPADDTNKAGHVGKQVRLMQVEGGTVYCIALSPDGKQLATAGKDGLRLWDLGTGKSLPRQEMNRHNCVAVAFSPDGKLVASGDSSTVRLWEAATG